MDAKKYEDPEEATTRRTARKRVNDLKKGPGASIPGSSGTSRASAVGRDVNNDRTVQDPDDERPRHAVTEFVADDDDQEMAYDAEYPNGYENENDRDEHGEEFAFAGELQTDVTDDPRDPDFVFEGIDNKGEPMNGDGNATSVTASDEALKIRKCDRRLKAKVRRGSGPVGLFHSHRVRAPRRPRSQGPRDRRMDSHDSDSITPKLGVNFGTFLGVS